MNETIQSLEASAFKVPTDFPESDGTAEWNSTTLILVELGAGKIHFHFPRTLRLRFTRIFAAPRTALNTPNIFTIRSH